MADDMPTIRKVADDEWPALLAELAARKTPVTQLAVLPVGDMVGPDLFGRIGFRADAVVIDGTIPVKFLSKFDGALTHLFLYGHAVDQRCLTKIAADFPKGVTGLPGNPRNHQSARNERFRQPDFAR